MRNLWFYLAAMLMCSCSHGHAGIRKASWANRGEQPRIPGQIADTDIGLPSSLKSDQDVYVIVTIGPAGRRAALVLLARESADPRKIATALDHATRPISLPHRRVYWGRAGHYCEAWQDVSPDYFLSRRVDIRVPVGRIVSKIRSSELNPHALLRVDGKDPIQGLGPSAVTIEGYRWYNVSDVPEATVAHVAIPLPWSPSYLLKAVGLLAAFPVAALCLLVLAIAVGTNERMPVDQRRKWYVNVYAGGTSCLILGFSVAVLAFWDRVSDFLAATSSSSALLRVVPVEAGMLLLILAAGWFVGLRILPPKNSSDEKKLFPFMPLWALILMTVFRPILLFVWEQTEGMQIIAGSLVLIAFYALWIVLSKQVMWLWVKSRLALCEVDRSLTDRADGIAEEMGVRIKDVRIDHTEDGRFWANALVFTNQGYLVVSRKSLDVLTPEQMDWILAHEIAHVKHGTSLARRALHLLIPSVSISMLLLSTRLEMNAVTAIGLIVSFLGALIVLGMSDDRLSRLHELEADRSALLTTKDLAAAETALIRLTDATEYPEMHHRDTTHPAVEKRLSALRQTARDTGLRLPCSEQVPEVRCSAATEADNDQGTTG